MSVGRIVEVSHVLLLVEMSLALRRKEMAVEEPGTSSQGLRVIIVPLQYLLGVPVMSVLINGREHVPIPMECVEGMTVAPCPSSKTAKE
jgi:hypothetical protein